MDQEVGTDYVLTLLKKSCVDDLHALHKANGLLSTRPPRDCRRDGSSQKIRKVANPNPKFWAFIPSQLCTPKSKSMYIANRSWWAYLLFCKTRIPSGFHLGLTRNINLLIMYYFLSRLKLWRVRSSVQSTSMRCSATAYYKINHYFLCGLEPTKISQTFVILVSSCSSFLLVSLGEPRLLTYDRLFSARQSCCPLLLWVFSFFFSSTLSSLSASARDRGGWVSGIFQFWWV